MVARSRGAAPESGIQRQGAGPGKTSSRFGYRAPGSDNAGSVVRRMHSSFSREVEVTLPICKTEALNSEVRLEIARLVTGAREDPNPGR